MSILTPTEISECLTGGPTAVARAIEAAVIKRLAAGVSVEPEQVAARWPSVPGSHHYAGAGKCPPNSFGPDSEDLFTRHQLQTAIAAARVAALKEVVALCDPDALGLEQGDDCATGVYRVEKAIRALLGKELTP